LFFASSADAAIHAARRLRDWRRKSIGDAAPFRHLDVFKLADDLCPLRSF
jgi:hypothetical protein